jgi:hypothetical protein
MSWQCIQVDMCGVPRGQFVWGKGAGVYLLFLRDLSLDVDPRLETVIPFLLFRVERHSNTCLFRCSADSNSQPVGFGFWLGMG